MRHVNWVRQVNRYTYGETGIWTVVLLPWIDPLLYRCVLSLCDGWVVCSLCFPRIGIWLLYCLGCLEKEGDSRGVCLFYRKLEEVVFYRIATLLLLGESLDLFGDVSISVYLSLFVFLRFHTSKLYLMTRVCLQRGCTVHLLSLGAVVVGFV